MNSNYKKSNYNLVYEIENNKIIFNTLTGALVVVNNDEYEKYSNIDTTQNIQDDIVLLDLYENKFIVDVNFDELSMIKYNLFKSRYSKESLSLTIAPTLNCNFKCSYCYEQKGRELDTNLMDRNTQEALIDFISKRLSNCKELSITWYGGEPLLAYDVIKELTGKIIQICKEKDVVYTASMVTNGYLLGNYNSEDLKKLNIKYIQVTIDGPKKIHDTRRILHNNGKTYDKIVNNIIKLQYEFFITVRVNIDKDNKEYIEQLKSDLKQQGLENYYLSVAPVINDENPYDEKCISRKDFSRIWLYYNQSICENEILNSEEKIRNIENYCDADHDNAFVVDNLGNVYKCWKDIGNKKYSIFNLKNKVNENKELFYNYLSYDPAEDENCKKCKLLPKCMGGCPNSRLNKMSRCTNLKYCIEDILKSIVKNNI